MGQPTPKVLASEEKATTTLAFVLVSLLPSVAFVLMGLYVLSSVWPQTFVSYLIQKKDPHFLAFFFLLTCNTLQIP